jgi:hypothetical protein
VLLRVLAALEAAAAAAANKPGRSLLPAFALLPLTAAAEVTGHALLVAAPATKLLLPAAFLLLFPVLLHAWLFPPTGAGAPAAAPLLLPAQAAELAAAALRSFAARLLLPRAALAAAARAAASSAFVKSQVGTAGDSPPAASQLSAMSTQYMGPGWPGQPNVRLLLLLLLLLAPLLPAVLVLPGPMHPLKLFGSAASKLCMITVPSACSTMGNSCQAWHNTGAPNTAQHEEAGAACRMLKPAVPVQSICASQGSMQYQHGRAHLRLR